MMSLFAHAEDLHVDTTSDFVHAITQPVTALALFVGGTIAILVLVKYFTKATPPHLLLLLLGICFVAGVTMFSIVPAVSILAISVGILIALSFTLLAIAG